ncbi:MAG TPA: hypothetical protein VFJ16_16255 [Longimicrobium sp.]|nr:hypothetical protein [Longimicrobium sp.]
MSYHYMGRRLDAVDTPPDPLDSCAYSILVALFSLVEPHLEAESTQRCLGSLGSKLINRNNLPQWKTDAQAAEGTREDRVVFLGKLVLKKDCSVERLEKNEKLSYYFNQVAGAANAEDLDLLKHAVARFRAQVLLANEPGDQCIAVVMDAERNLYVTGNGLWAHGDSFPAGDRVVVPPDWDDEQARNDYFGDVARLRGNTAAQAPWFTSRAATELALEMISPDIIAEYTARRVIYISPALGDSNGRFHAEMQMLDYMISNSIYPIRRYIGVSKPCCSYCAALLGPAGLRFWTEHPARGPNPATDGTVPTQYACYRHAGTVQAFREALQRG